MEVECVIRRIMGSRIYHLGNNHVDFDRRTEERERVRENEDLWMSD